MTLTHAQRPLPPLYALRAFEAAARHGSFTRAAEALCLTQSAISRHVKTLESQLGCALFLRQGGGKLQLTDTGARLAHELAQGFALIERACAQARQPNPLLRLKAPSSLTLHWLMAELEAFQRQAPHVAVQLTSAWMDPDDVDFRSEPFDCAILLLSAPQHADWHTVKLFDEWLTPICAPALLGDTAWTLATLQQHELIHPTPDARDWRHWLAQCAPPDAQAWQRGKFLDSLQSGMTAAMQGHGVSIGDVALIRQDVLRGALATPLPQAVASGSSYYLVWPKSDRTSTGLEALLAHLQAHAPLAELAGVTRWENAAGMAGTR